jgi:hypothetical protein
MQLRLAKIVKIAAAIFRKKYVQPKATADQI